MDDEWLLCWYCGTPVWDWPGVETALCDKCWGYEDYYWADWNWDDWEWWREVNA